MTFKLISNYPLFPIPSLPKVLKSRVFQRDKSSGNGGGPEITSQQLRRQLQTSGWWPPKL